MTAALNLIHSFPKRVGIDIIEFCFSDAYLGLRSLYPRQATLLKTIFLQIDDIGTQYDYDVLGEWSETFLATGNEGISPDIFERMRICKDVENRPWFREVIVPIGRRGSKGFIGAVATGFALWNYMNMGNPQAHFGIDPNKRLSVMVFAPKKEHAKANQWRDIALLLLSSPCFLGQLSKPQAESITLHAYSDEARMRELERRGIRTEMDLASFEVVAKESTGTAGRGPAGCILLFDEGAWMVESLNKEAAGARSMRTVYENAKPSLDQFREWGFIYESSSPWQKLGQFWDNYQSALEVDDETGLPAYPERFMLQLPSWGLAEDHERTGVHDNALMVVPEPQEYVYFPRIAYPFTVFDEQMKREQRINPETFAVERLGHFATVLDAYLSELRVDQMFSPWEDRQLVRQSRGILNVTYVAHGDPSTVGANFGFAIAHVEERVTELETEQGGEKVVMPHVVFDVIHSWRPGDYEENNFEIDYLAVEEELWGFIRAFMPATLTFDQFQATSTIQRLRHRVANSQLPKRTQITEVPATRPLNWEIAETFKGAINLGLLHCYGGSNGGDEHTELFELECKYLTDVGGRVEPPKVGPVTTKDIFDAASRVTHSLVGSKLASLLGRQFLGLDLHSTQQGGAPTAAENKIRALTEFSQASSARGMNTAQSRSGMIPSRSRRGGRGRRPPRQGRSW